MAATLFNQVNYPLSLLIENIDIGVIGLPEIQRPFVWGNAKVRDLFDSMLKGFPVGYFLFWQNGIGNGHKQIGPNAKQKVPSLLIVDGQQRLTSLYAVMKGKPVIRENFEQERIYIAFNPIKRTFAVTDAAIRRDPEYIPDISQVWSEKKGIFGIAKEYLSRIRQSRTISEEEEIKIQNAINDLDNIQNYPFTALEVSSSANEEEVSEIFVRVNSKGTPLNQADFILTLMSVFWDEGRTRLEEFCREATIPSKGKPSSYNYYIQPTPDQLVRTTIGYGFRRARLNYAYLILRGKDLETEEFSDERREAQFSIYGDAQAKVLDLTNWHEFLKAIQLSGFINEQIISSQTAILYAYVFYLIGKYDYQVDHFELRKIIAKWFFVISLTSRYSGSFESMMEQDLNRLKDVHNAREFINLLEHIIMDTLTDDYWNITLPNQLQTSSARTPSLHAYYASLVKLKARVLFSPLSVADLINPAIREKKSAVERHHLFPRGYLCSQGITEISETNQVANFALIEWKDNIDISDDSPSKYFPAYLSKYTKEEWKEINFLHALPERWYELDYHEFLEQRKKAIAKVIHAGFNTLI